MRNDRKKSAQQQGNLTAAEAQKIAFAAETDAYKFSTSRVSVLLMLTLACSHASMLALCAVIRLMDFPHLHISQVDVLQLGPCFLLAYCRCHCLLTFSFAPPDLMNRKHTTKLAVLSLHLSMRTEQMHQCPEWKPVSLSR